MICDILVHFRSLLLVAQHRRLWVLVPEEHGESHYQGGSVCGCDAATCLPQFLHWAWKPKGPKGPKGRRPNGHGKMMEKILEKDDQLYRIEMDWGLWEVPLSVRGLMEGLTCKPICEKLQFSNDVDWLGRYAAVPSLSMVPNCGMVKFHGLLMFIHIKGRVMNPLTVFFCIYVKLYTHYVEPYLWWWGDHTSYPII